MNVCTGKPSGIDSLNISSYPKDKLYIGLKLSVVPVGPSYNEYVMDQVYIYYFMFEANGVLYPDVYTRVIIIVLVIINTNNKICGGSIADVAGYYVYGEYS